jgi:hypothetical protein
MFDPARHFTPIYPAWDEAAARAAIREIADDAIAAVDPITLWPAHKMDEGMSDGDGSIYMGAAGVIWALDALRRRGLVSFDADLACLLAAGLERLLRDTPEFPYPHHASLLFGEIGSLLVQMRVAPAADLPDRMYAAAMKNNELPVLELMWGLAGSMLACVFMADMTGQERFRDLFQLQSARLLADLETDGPAPIWTQALYGHTLKFLGPVHGFAGNMIPLLRGWDWLTPEQQQIVAAASEQALAYYALWSDDGANWPPVVEAEDQGRKPLCQHCHGAPGMVSAFANAPFSTPGFEKLLLGGAMMTFHAGPLAKGSNLCHGTGGNGYALLKMFERTGDAVWLERARVFAMVAIDQMRQARIAYGMGRYSLWTGDIGLAVYLADCISGLPRFPTVDVF